MGNPKQRSPNEWWPWDGESGKFWVEVLHLMRRIDYQVKGVPAQGANVICLNDDAPYDKPQPPQENSVYLSRDGYLHGKRDDLRRGREDNAEVYTGYWLLTPEVAAERLGCESFKELCEKIQAAVLRHLERAHQRALDNAASLARDSVELAQWRFDKMLD